MAALEVKPPDPGVKSSLSYADKTKMNIRYDQKLKRNVLDIEVGKEKVEDEMILSEETVEKLLNKINMNIQTHVEGYQVSHGRKKAKIEVLCKSGLDLEQFCLQESIQVERGVKTNFIRPAGRRDVEVTVNGLGFNTPDSLIQEYIAKFGGELVTKDVIYERFVKGPFAGKVNGIRKYQVDFSKASGKMGTFHLLDGRKVKVFYRGNKSTCGWCHQDSAKCKGDARAKGCRESGTQQVLLADHMNKLWSEIGFSQERFETSEMEYDDLDTADNLGGDRKILQTSHFPRKLAHPKLDEKVKDKFSMVRIKNFPLNISEDEIIKFLQKEVDEKITAENIQTEITGHSTNIILGPEPSLEIVAKAIEVLDYNTTKKQFFENRKLHAQMHRPLTPEKQKPVQTNPDPNADNSLKPVNEEGIVKSVVQNFNKSDINSSKTSQPKSNQVRKNSSSHTSMSSAATHPVARHKEDLRSSSTLKK